MSVTRRGFFVAGAAAVAGAGAAKFRGSTAVAAEVAVASEEERLKSEEPKPRAVLKLSSQFKMIPGRDFPEKLATMEQWEFDAVELDGTAVGREKEVASAVKKTKLKISVICGAKGTADGRLVSDDASKRAPAFDDIRRALTTAGVLGAVGVIMVPAFNNQTRLTNQEIRKVLLDLLPASASTPSRWARD